VLLLFAAGCAADRSLNVRLSGRVERPRVAAVVFFIDGLGRAAFERARAAGDLPHIERHLLSRGVVAGHAVAAVPTLTYANSVTLLTGRFPGHHGIIANRWFDREAGRAADYCTIATYRDVDADYVAPTIHELLDGADTASAQAAQRRGATYTFDNWATSGINWFFGNYTGVDCLVAQNLELVARRAETRGRWPVFILAYFPGVDHVGHLYGPESAQYAQAVRDVDRQIGRFCEGLIQADLYRRTNLILVSDHGVAAVERGRVLDVEGILSANGGVPVATCDVLRQRPERIDRCDAVVASSGSRWCALYLRAGGDWGSTFFLPGAEARDPELARWLDDPGGRLLDHPAVEVSAGRHGPEAVWVRTRRGVSLIHRERRGNERFYRYEPSPADALGYLEDKAMRQFVAAGAHDSRAWLERTAKAVLPDFVPQVVEMFDSPRAGDIVLFAARGWNFMEPGCRGAHGSVLAEDLLVPLVLAGPNVSPAWRIPYARNCDVMPTVLALLGRSDALERAGALDGIVLVPQAFGGGDGLAAP